MEPIHIFVWKEDGVTQAITDKAMLTQMVLQDCTKPDGKVVPMSTLVPKPSNPEGSSYIKGDWHTVILKDDATREDDLKAEQSINVVNEHGFYIYQSWRQQDAFAAQVIESWDFKDPYAKPGTLLPVNEESLKSLPGKVAALIVGIVWARFKGSPKTFRFPG